MLSIVLAAALAAVSSAGSRANTGRRAAWAGRKAVPAMAAATDRAYTEMGGPPVATSTPATPTRRQRTRSAPIITRFFGSRSASELSSGPEVAMAR